MKKPELKKPEFMKKLDIKRSTALALGGITLAGIFLLIAIIRPASLDWIFRADKESSDQIKKEMERQKGSNADAKPGEKKSGAITPTASPEETATKPGCISRDQVVKVIGASEEAREGRVIWTTVNPEGSRVIVAYRKKTFLGIGSGENQIEGILRRGLRNRFPDSVIKSVRVRSNGNKSVRRGGQNVNAEVLVIEPLQAGCRWLTASTEPR